MTQTELFIKEIFDAKEVLILQSDEGFAITFSEEFQYEDDSQLEVICFWSNREKALKAKKNQWKNHSIETLNLNDFIEQWLIGMFEEVSLAGLNFDADGKGEEHLPLDLLLDITNFAIREKINFELKFFKSFEELRKEIIEIKENSI